MKQPNPFSNSSLCLWHYSGVLSMDLVCLLGNLTLLTVETQPWGKVLLNIVLSPLRCHLSAMCPWKIDSNSPNPSFLSYKIIPMYCAMAAGAEGVYNL